MNNDIDIIVKYPNGTMKNCKEEWIGIEWNRIFDILEINLCILQNHSINYRATEHVENMRNTIEVLCNTTFYDVDINIKEDAKVLLQKFNSYVSNGARIHIY